MIEHPALDATYAALADPVRRAILVALRDGEARITDLAAPFRMTFAGVSRHIGVLEKAGLVTREKRGREHWLHLTPGALDDAREWMVEQAEFWAPRLDALTTRLQRKAQQPMSEAPRITITRRLPATPAEVYAEWLDPEGLREWMCPHPARPTDVAVDPVEGGSFRFDIVDGPATMVVTGRYLALEPGQLIKFTWSCDTWADPAVESVVTISLTAHGDDCDMTLTHERLPAEQIPSHRNGWTAIAEQLGAWLTERADTAGRSRWSAAGAGSPGSSPS